MNFCFLLAFVTSVAVQPAQDENFWHVLAEVSFEKSRSATDYEIEKPIFSKRLKASHNKKISLKGYIIPLGEVGDSDKFMLSSLPFNVCYFCGAAGPETVVEIETNESIKFTTQPIRVEGLLFLNESDPDHHIYILKNARLLK